MSSAGCPTTDAGTLERVQTETALQLWDDGQRRLRQAEPAVRAKLEEQGFDLVPAQPPAALAELIASDLKTWPSIIKAAGAKVD